MISQTSTRFWDCYDRLPDRIKSLADKNFVLWKTNPRHPSLQFKQVKPRLWSIRIGIEYRALAAYDGTTISGFGLESTMSASS
jgi:hypothetical protein